MGALEFLTLVLCVLFPLVACQCISKVDETVIDTLKQVRGQLTSLENKLKDKTCEPGWLKYKGSCYFFSKNSNTWINAERECRQKSSNLVKIESASENNWIKRQARVTHKQRWIGAREVHGQWEWVSDLSQLTFTSWAKNEPNNAKENCAHIHQVISYNWNDHKCNMRFNFICEKPAGQ